MFYGVTHQKHLVDMARAVCAALGDGSEAPVRLLLETAAQETDLGAFKDPTPYAAGSGLTQLDRIAFEDVQRRCRPHWRAKLITAFGIDVIAVEYRELEHSPLLALIFCRLHYKLVPYPIPETLAERAAYYKRFYNSPSGKATVDEYIRSAAFAARLLGDPV